MPVYGRFISHVRLKWTAALSCADLNEFLGTTKFYDLLLLDFAKVAISVYNQFNRGISTLSSHSICLPMILGKGAPM